MEIYIAICCDRHVDEDIQIFTEPGPAIQYAKEFVPEGYDIIEQELTERMKKEGWLYLANYGVEGNHVRVETGILDIDVWKDALNAACEELRKEYGILMRSKLPTTAAGVSISIEILLNLLKGET